MRFRLMKILKWLLGGAVFIFSAMIFTVLLLVSTQGGTRWLAAQAIEGLNRDPQLNIQYEALGGTLLEGVNIQALSVSMDTPQGDQSFSFGRLEMLWSPLQLLNSELVINRLALADIDLQLAPADPDAPAPDPAGILNQMFSLPFAVRVSRLSVDSLSVSDSGAPLFGLRSVSASLALDNRQLVIGQLDLLADPVSVSGNVSLAAGDFAISGQLDWRLASDGTQFSGQAALGGTLANIDLDHQLSSPLIVQSAGTVTSGLFDSAAPEFSLNHEFTDINAAALGAGLEMLESVSGSLSTRGTPAELTVAGELAVTVSDFEPLAITLDLDYDSGGVHFRQLDIVSPLLDLAASGDLGLQPALDLDLQWQMNRMDPGAYLEGIRLADLQGNGSVNIQQQEGALLSSVNITSLSARLNDYPLTASGQLQLLDSVPELINLSIRAQENELQLNGSYDQVLDFSWNISAPALEVLMPGLSGMVAGAGTLSGSVEMPEVAGNLEADSLVLESTGAQFELGRLTVAAAYEAGLNNISLQAADIVLSQTENSFEISRLELDASGIPARHSFALHIQTATQSLDLAATGDLSAGQWDGEVTAAEIQSEYGNWSLQQALVLSASGNAAEAALHCWTSADISLCGEGQWNDQNGYQADLDLSGVPLGYLNTEQVLDRILRPQLRELQREKPPGLTSLQQAWSLYLPENSFIEGTLQTNISINGAPGVAVPDLEIELQPQNLLLGLVAEQQGETQTLQPQITEFSLQSVQIQVSKSASDWHNSAAFTVLQQDSTGLDLQGTFDGNLSVLDGGQLDGMMSLDFRSIAWLETLLPMIRNSQGELFIQGTIGGNFERPLILADASLANGGFLLPEYGLDIADLNLSIHSDVENAITLSGSASSGAGSIQLESRVTTPFLDSRQMQLQISGQDFQVLNNGTTRLLLNPDLAVDFSNQRLDIQGEITVPVLDMNLSESEFRATGSSVGVSRDVVIVAAPQDQQELMRENNQRELLRRIPVNANVMLVLGDEVRFRGFGLDLLLDGDLTLEQTLDRPLLAYGEVSIAEGSYEIYNQRLVTESGKLIFLGNPMNPALDIRASRQAQDTVVGIQMNGTLRNIQAQLFSTPSLPESEILSVLITGKSFRNINNDDSDALLNTVANLGIERGQGLTNLIQSELGLDTVQVNGGANFRDSSLGLGKYITPDLFMRYDIGLFEKRNSLTLDYSLSERMKLQVETGLSQSVDLTYTVEK